MAERGQSRPRGGKATPGPKAFIGGKDFQRRGKVVEGSKKLHHSLKTKVREPGDPARLRSWPRSRHQPGASSETSSAGGRSKSTRLTRACDPPWYPCKAQVVRWQLRHFQERMLWAMVLPATVRDSKSGGIPGILPCAAELANNLNLSLT